MKAERVREAATNPSAVRVPARAPRWTVPLVKTLLALTDVALALLSFVFAFYLRHHEAIVHRTSRGNLAWSREFAPYALLLPLVIPIRLLLLRYYDLYRVRGELSFVEDGARVFKAMAIGSLLIVAAAFIYRGGVAYRTFSYSRAIFFLDFLIALVSIGAVRMLLRAGQILVRRRGINLIPTLIVGRGPEAAICIQEMRARPELGYRVIGIVENGSIDAAAPSSFEGVPVIADLKSLPRLGVRLGRESLWFPALASAAGLAALLWCVKAGRAPAPLPPRRPASLVRDPALPADFYHAVGYRLAGSLVVRADALERLSDLAHRLAGQGPFLPAEALRQCIQCDMAALPAVIAALGYRSVEEAGELRFHAPARRKGSRPTTRRRAKRKPRHLPDSPFAALRDIKFQK